MTDVYFVALAFHLIDFAISERRRILHYIQEVTPYFDADAPTPTLLSA